MGGESNDLKLEFLMVTRFSPSLLPFPQVNIFLLNKTFITIFTMLFIAVLTKENINKMRYSIASDI